MRRYDWLARLGRTVREHEAAPFEWGKNDCVLFCARCVDAVLGTEYARSLHSDRRGAARLLHAEGGLAAAVTKRLGPPHLEGEPISGDICQIGPRTLGLFWAGAVLVVCAEGVEPRPRAIVQRFWRVR